MRRWLLSSPVRFALGSSRRRWRLRCRTLGESEGAPRTKESDTIDNREFTNFSRRRGSTAEYNSDATRQQASAVAYNPPRKRVSGSRRVREVDVARNGSTPPTRDSDPSASPVAAADDDDAIMM
jgi:hypothetical protein